MNFNIDRTDRHYPGIYTITNIKTGVLYVGSCLNFYKRWYQHKILLQQGVHTCKELQADYNSFGEKYFEFTILQKCYEDRLCEWENYHIANHSLSHKLYNTQLVAIRTNRRRLTPFERMTGRQKTIFREFAASFDLTETDYFELWVKEHGYPKGCEPFEDLEVPIMPISAFSKVEPLRVSLSMLFTHKQQLQKIANDKQISLQLFIDQSIGELIKTYILNAA